MRYQEDEVYKKIKDLFPIDYEKNLWPEFLKSFFKILKKKTINDCARVSGEYGKTVYEKLTKKYSILPQECEDVMKKCEEIVEDLVVGTPRWRSPQLQYNIGTATNTIVYVVNIFI